MLFFLIWKPAIGVIEKHFFEADFQPDVSFCMGIGL